MSKIENFLTYAVSILNIKHHTIYVQEVVKEKVGWKIRFIGLLVILLTLSLPKISEGGIKAELRDCILNEFEEGEISLKIEGSEKDLASGRFKNILIEAKQFSTMAKLGEFFPKNSQLKREILNFSLPGLVVDKGIAFFVKGKFGIETFKKQGKFQILELEESFFYGLISERNLEYFIQKQNPQFKNLKVKLLTDSVKVSFKAPFLFLIIPVEMLGRLVLENPSQIYIKDFKLHIGGIRALILENLIMTKLNPIVDLTQLPFSVKLEKIEITPGQLKISLSIKI